MTCRRISSARSSQLTYQTESLVGVVGLYYFEQSSDDIVTVELNPPPPGIQRDNDNNIVDNNSWAAFAQWTYNVTDKLSLTAGGRYTEDEKGSFPDQFDLSTPNNKQVPVRWYRDTFSSFTPSASIAYRWTDDAMTYVSYAEGFKGGGWNSHFNDPPLSAAEQAALHEFRQEEAETIEVGVQARSDRGNAAVERRGVHFRLHGHAGDLSRAFPRATGHERGRTVHYQCGQGQHRRRGAGADVDARVGLAASTPAWATSMPRSTSSRTCRSRIIPPGLVEGNRLPFAPEWQGHVGIEYTAHAGSLLITPRVDASYQDTTFFDATNTREIAQLDNVTTVNATVQLSSDGGPWKVIVGVNNATDELYPIAGNSSLTTGSGYAEIAYARPREWFANFQYEF